ncbi:MAG: diadenylate cyclase CdaA [Acholeplasma sp.]|nr:diadenylate cyclase CdaA [Acholeplasma sp.]
MMFLGIQIQGNELWRIILDGYLIFILVVFLLKLIFSNSRLLNFAVIFGVLILVRYITEVLELKTSLSALDYMVKWAPILFIIIMAPDFRRTIEFSWKKDNKKKTVIMGNETTREALLDAAFQLSSQKTGALITIEKHNTLDQFADRAIMMHSIISKELLLNIFIPNTPLHDGAVIIRGDEILCAAAYFILSEKEVEDRTMGSRHRAALGISEVTDALTIVISEETGDVSIAVEGILLKMNDRDKLSEYLSMFMR